MNSLKSAYFFIASTITYYVIERWLNLLESLVPDFIPHLNFVDIAFFGIAGFAIYLIMKEKRKKSNGEINSFHVKDIHNIFIKLSNSRIKNNDGKIALELPVNLIFFTHDGITRKISDGSYCEEYFIHEYDDYYFFNYVLEHLKTGYPKIHKRWTKIKNLLEKANEKTKDEQLELHRLTHNELVNFNFELSKIIKQLKTRKDLKGSCDGCK